MTKQIENHPGTARATFIVRRIVMFVVGIVITMAPRAAADDQQPVKRTMRIQVLGPDDKPMPSVKIHAAIWAKDPAKTNRDYVCDADGQALVDLPEAIDILRLWATSPGHVGLFANWWPQKQPGDKIPDEFTFQLDKGTVIGGLIKNEDNQPIEGAKVEVALVQPPGGELRNRPYPNTWLAEGDDAPVTDAQGRWVLADVPAGDGVEVRIRLTHPDYVSDYVWGKLQEEQHVSTQSLREKTGTIVMPRGISIGGFVVDEELRKVADAVVVWGDDPYSQDGSQEVRTDRNGVFHLPPLPPGPMNVTVIAPGWAPDQQKIDLSANNNRVNFSLKRGKTTRLRFVDHSGAAIPGVYVGIKKWRGGKALYNHKHPNVLDTNIPDRADKNGVFEWTWAPSDPVTYVFYHQTHQGAETRLSLTAETGEHKITLPLPRR
jgi:hypothetical protein